MLNKRTCLLVQQEDVPSCSAMFNKKTRLLVRQEDMSKTCSLVEQEDMSSCWTRRHVFLFNRKISPLVEQEEISEMSSCSARTHRKRCLLVEQEDMTCLLVQQEDVVIAQQEEVFFGTTRHVVWLHEDMSSCWAGRHVVLFNTKTCLLFHKMTSLRVEQEDLCLLLNKKTCFLALQKNTFAC